MDLYEELNESLNDLQVSLKNLRVAGSEYAEAYKKYRILLSQELLRLKAEGMPVTIAYDVARGKEEVAQAKYDEICKESIFKANQEAINTYKIKVKILENQIDREYRVGE